MEPHLYSGAGNRFVIYDLRRGETLPDVVAECRAAGTDGAVVLREAVSGSADFRMEFFNPDGSTGMMCGNGGRCLVDFAAHCGIVPSNGREYVFEGPDGLHRAEVLSRGIVRLGMTTPSGIRRGDGWWFVDTGARHCIVFVRGLESYDVGTEGRRLRHGDEFAPEGANVDFVEVKGPGKIAVRTFEKGVEGETGACGTGIVASAIAAFLEEGPADGARHYDVRAREDELSVDFVYDAGRFGDVFLTGPVEDSGIWKR